jgi:hypothetical protein
VYSRAHSAASIDRAGVRPLCSAHKTAFMNAIAAHKDELERLLEKLSGDIAVSGITFVALVDAYITRLDANCPDVSARVDPPPEQINRRINMDPTLTQNCALYYAQHKTSERGATFFRKFRAAARKRALLSHSPYATNFSGVFRHHRDNGR